MIAFSLVNVRQGHARAHSCAIFLCYLGGEIFHLVGQLPRGMYAPHTHRSMHVPLAGCPHLNDSKSTFLGHPVSPTSSLTFSNLGTTQDYVLLTRMLCFFQSSV